MRFSNLIYLEDNTKARLLKHIVDLFDWMIYFYDFLLPTGVLW